MRCAESRNGDESIPIEAFVAFKVMRCLTVYKNRRESFCLLQYVWQKSAIIKLNY